jgi:hypothetical protein
MLSGKQGTEAPMQASDPLEAWVDESIRRSQQAGYDPIVFIRMRQDHATVRAMERLMQSGQIQSGLIRLRDLGMAEEWSVEAGILRFPERFTPAAREAARWRLDHIDELGLR